MKPGFPKPPVSPAARAFFLTALLVLSMTAGATRASAAVDPALLALMPPDSTVLFGVELENVLASPFGQFTLAQLPNADGVTQMASVLGFDLKHDLTELVGATSAPNGTKTKLLLARGNFQVSKLVALAAVTGATLDYYNGVQVITPKNKATAFAFLDSSTLAIGSPDSIQAVIDRSAAHAQFAGGLANKAIAASSVADAWIATVTPVSQFLKSNAAAIPGTPPGALPPNVLQQVRETSFGVRFNKNGAVASTEFTTSSAQQAQLLFGMLQIVSAMVQSNKNASVTPLASLLSGAQFALNGAALDITVPIPEQALEKMYSPHPQPLDKASASPQQAF